MGFIDPLAIFGWSELNRQRVGRYKRGQACRRGTPLSFHYAQAPDQLLSREEVAALERELDLASSSPQKREGQYGEIQGDGRDQHEAPLASFLEGNQIRLRQLSSGVKLNLKAADDEKGTAFLRLVIPGEARACRLRPVSNPRERRQHTHFHPSALVEIFPPKWILSWRCGRPHSFAFVVCACAPVCSIIVALEMALWGTFLHASVM